MLKTYFQRKKEYRKLLSQVKEKNIFILKNQKSIRAYYQNFYEYILEDEAQDSNLLQNKIVALITNKNLVKVGDSNQNITGTFTLSSPKLFRNFCAKSPCVMSLNTSYRSSKNIIDFSNFFLKYTSLKHPCLNARKALKMNFMHLNELELGRSAESDKNKIRAYYAEYFEEEILICLKKVKAFKKKFPEKTIGLASFFCGKRIIWTCIIVKSVILRKVRCLRVNY